MLNQKIIVSGCSNLAGTKLSLKSENYKELNVAAKLKEKLDYEVFDLAIEGSDNRSIISRTVDLINTGVYPDYVIIQFTYPERFRTPKLRSAPKPGFHIHHPQNINMKADNLKAHGLTKSDYRFLKQYYDFAKSDLMLQLELTLDIQLMEGYLKSKDIPYSFIVWPYMTKSATNRNAFRDIDTSRIINYDDYTLYDMYTVLRSYEFITSSEPSPDDPRVLDGHFMEDALDFMANSIIDHMINGTKLVAQGDYKDKPFNDRFLHIY
jgi:hypothetical protein